MKSTYSTKRPLAILNLAIDNSRQMI